MMDAYRASNKTVREVCESTKCTVGKFHAILVHIRRVNLVEHGAKIETVKQTINLVGHDSTKSVYCTISRLL